MDTSPNSYKLFSDIPQVIESVTQCEPEVRYQRQRSMADAITQQQSRAGKLTVCLWDWIRDDAEAWGPHHKTFEEFEALYPAIPSMILTYQRVRNRTAEARKALLAGWPTCGYYILRYPVHILAPMRRCMVAGLTFEDCLLMVVRAVIDRVSNPRRGVSSQLSPTPDDWNRVADGKYQPIPYKPAVLRSMGYEWKDSMLLSVTPVPLSGGPAVLPDQATQAGDNAGEGSSKQAVQKSSSAPADDAGEGSSEKVGAAPTIKVTNKDKGKQREVRVTPERKDGLLTPQATPAKRKAETEASEEEGHKRIKLPVTPQPCECVGATDGWKADLRALDEARAPLPNFAAFLMLSPVWYSSWTLCQRHFQVLARCLALRVVDEEQLSVRMGGCWARRWNIEELINSHPDWFQAYMVAGVQDDDDEDMDQGDDNQAKSDKRAVQAVPKVIVVEDDADKELGAPEDEGEGAEEEEGEKGGLNQEDEFDVLLGF
jgi:hypothetical protein